MALSGSYTFVGRGNWSIDATSGSATSGGAISAIVPTGSVIQKAYLYESAFFDGNHSSGSVTLSSGASSSTISDFVDLGVTSAVNLEAYRADVTDYVSQVVGNGSSAAYTFNVGNLTKTNVDGFSLVIVYANPTEQVRTIALLDGFSSNSGDSFKLTFDSPLQLDTNFSAQLSLGIGFGFQPSSQSSTVDVNGRILTTSAGGQDDGVDDNGGLITAGGIGDSPDNPANPNAGSEAGVRYDDELYDLARGNGVNSAPFLKNGDTGIVVNTNNPSNDDNIFFAGFNITKKVVVDSDQNDAPVAVSDGGTGFGTTESATFRTANVLLNDFDPDKDPIKVVSFDASSSIGLVTSNGDGTFNYNPNGKFNALNTGESATDSFTYTISDGELTSTTTVFVTVNGQSGGSPPPSSGAGFIRLTDSADNMNYSTAKAGVLVQALGGDDLVIGSRFNDSLNGGSGNDRLTGGGGNDVLQGGAGMDRLSGGTGNDTFTFRPGDLGQTKATADNIVDFHGAGNVNYAVEQDFLGFFGFSAGSTLAFSANANAAGNLQYYYLTDAANSNNSGYILIQMADGSAKLGNDDYKFFA